MMHRYEFDMQGLSCIQLRRRDRLTPGELATIAELIYETDEYIYPALFPTKTIAIEVLGEVLKRGDGLFDVDNIYVAKLNKEIVGLILWVDGPLAFDHSVIEATARRLRCPIRNLDVLIYEYFDMYAEASRAGVTTIINLCVAGHMRRRGIGRFLLGNFLDNGPDAIYELSVLADNHAAISLYEQHGFMVSGEYDGFALGKAKPRCLDMVRKPQIPSR